MIFFSRFPFIALLFTFLPRKLVANRDFSQVPFPRIALVIVSSSNFNDTSATDVADFQEFYEKVLATSYPEKYVSLSLDDDGSNIKITTGDDFNDCDNADNIITTIELTGTTSFLGDEIGVPTTEELAQNLKLLNMENELEQELLFSDISRLEISIGDAKYEPTLNRCMVCSCSGRKFSDNSRQWYIMSIMAICLFGTVAMVVAWSSRRRQAEGSRSPSIAYVGGATIGALPTVIRRPVMEFEDDDDSSKML